MELHNEVQKVFQFLCILRALGSLTMAENQYLCCIYINSMSAFDIDISVYTAHNKIV